MIRIFLDYKEYRYWRSRNANKCLDKINQNIEMERLM